MSDDGSDHLPLWLAIKKAKLPGERKLYIGAFSPDMWEDNSALPTGTP